MSGGVTTTAAGGSPPHRPGDGPEVTRRQARESSSSWSLVDRLGLAFAWMLGITFCAIIVAIIVYVAVQGIRYLHPDLLWTNPKVSDTQSGSGGFLDPIIGTFLTSGLALAIATPVGIGVAVWLSEYNRPKALARLVESTVEMLAGAPSVVLALFGIVVFDSSFVGFLSQSNGGIVLGKSQFAAGIILSFVALPLIVSSVREGLQAIPNHVREASYAVGKSKITTIRRILLPTARPSVVTGAMLGLGHSLGDTAIIVLLAGDTQVIQPAGNVPILSDFRGTASTLTSYVFDNAPTGDLNHTQLAWAAAFVLMLIVLILNLIVDVFSRRSRELKWS